MFRGVMCILTIVATLFGPGLGCCCSAPKLARFLGLDSRIAPVDSPNQVEETPHIVASGCCCCCEEVVPTPTDSDCPSISQPTRPCSCDRHLPEAIVSSNNLNLSGEWSKLVVSDWAQLPNIHPATLSLSGYTVSSFVPATHETRHFLRFHCHILHC